MGCNSSHVVLPQDRRRLSVSDAIPSILRKGNSGLRKDPRGLVKVVSSEELMQLLSELNADASGKLTMRSETDELLALMDSFGAKKMSSERSDLQRTRSDLSGCTAQTPPLDELDFPKVPYGFGFACHKGKKPESPNQDSWFMLSVEGSFSMYGVFDGHGWSGHHISNFVKDNLPKLIVRNEGLKAGGTWSESLREAFLDMQGMIAAASEPLDNLEPLGAILAGTTATVVVHDERTNKLIVANVGDSAACLATVDEQLKVSKLTTDHKPTLPQERARIEKSGGSVIWDGYASHRVFVKGASYPGLNMSRCLGDLVGHSKAGLSAEPEITEHDLGDKDRILVLGSDGLWDYMSHDEVMTIVRRYGSGKAHEAAEALAKKAWDRWISSECGTIVDDITALVIFLSHEVSI